MKRPWLFAVIGCALCGVLALALVFPRFMIAPGPLASAHADLANNCFACHAPWQGTVAERCEHCHKLAEIGLRTSTGAPIDRAANEGGIKLAFHLELSMTNCVACHGEHAGPVLTHADKRPFTHALLKPELRTQCSTCHVAPSTPLHRKLTANCSQCHQPEHWKPATFDHAKLFLLEGPHKAACATCHVENDSSRYTCFGCHEHQPNEIRAKHLEEGITRFDNCVECHRSGENGESSEHEGKE